MKFLQVVELKGFFRYFCLFTQWFIVLSLACCSKKENLAEFIRIGEVGTFTGAEASFGLSTHHGIELAVRQINASGGVHGKKIELLVHDDQGRPEETTSATTQLITQARVVALIGGHPSSRGLAVSPIAQRYQIPLMHSASTHPQITQVGNYIFRVCFIDPFQGEVMAKFALDHLKLKHIAILRDIKSDYSIGLSDIFKKVFAKLGGEILIEQNYSSGDVDFKSQLTSIRAKNPDAIFVPGYYTEAALVARQARELGIQVPLLGGDGWDSPRLLQMGGTALNNAYYSTHYSSDNQAPKVQSFISEYRKAYGETPDGLAALGFDATMILVDSIRRAKEINPAQIQIELQRVKDYVGVTGKITLDHNRNPLKSAVILQIINEKAKFFATIEP